jgi:hypothetical protein
LDKAPPSPPLEGGTIGAQAIFELEQEEKYKNYNEIIEFKKLVLELNSELGLY